jgi:hypothetical protein
MRHHAEREYTSYNRASDPAEEAAGASVNTPGKKPSISERKLEANRRNGAKSHGPVTEEGKSVSRWNALKHGLTSRNLVIQGGPAKESLPEYEHLLTCLREELKPASMLAEILLEEIAGCYWRIRRANMAEAGHIRSKFDFAAVNDKLNDVRAMERSTGTLKSTPAGIEFVLTLFAKLRAQIADDGFTASGYHMVIEGPLTAEIVLVTRLLEYDKAAKDAKNAQVREHLVDHMKKLIDEHRRILERMKPLVAEQQELLTIVRNLQNRLPLDDSSDRRLRYETTIYRRLYRAIREFQNEQQRHQRSNGAA